MQNGKNQGFVYIGLLIGLTVIGVGLSAVSEVWYQSRQREREEDLLFIGNQFRQAITRYYIESPKGSLRFPMRMEDLLQDDRSVDKSKRFLRKIYPDPMTGKMEWGEIRLASGQLVGVHSLSTEAPLKVAEFSAQNKDLADKTRYSEWDFRSALPAANPILPPNASYSTPGGGTQSPGAATPQRPLAPTPPGFTQPMPRPRP
ncbi:MAG: type II secretion system protein [Rhodoferax sp.]|uniref:type II secretion system protein n=1 Tax=Rhodoferax sp. TaxID=50421 RepID=UPI003016739B